MDGTFLNDRHEFDQLLFAQVLELCEKSETQFAVASGSQYARLVQQFRDVAHSISYICQNGSSVYIGDQLISSSQISQKAISDIIVSISSSLEDCVRQYIYLGLESAYVINLHTELVSEVKKYYPSLKVVNDISDIYQKHKDTILGLALVSNDMLSATNFVQHVREVIPNGYSCLSSGFNFFLVQKNDVDKVAGVRSLQQYFGINSEDTFVFGNNYNDIGMLKSTNNAYVMLNSPDEMRDEFTVLQKTNNQSGVQCKIISILKANFK